MLLVLSVIRLVNYALGDHYHVPDGYIVGLIVYEEITAPVGKKIHLKKIVIMMRVHYSTAAGNVTETEKLLFITYNNADTAHPPKAHFLTLDIFYHTISKKSRILHKI
jgi:hypothetical protein